MVGGCGKSSKDTPHPDPFDAVRPELVEGMKGSQDRTLPMRGEGSIKAWGEFCPPCGYFENSVRIFSNALRHY